MLLGDLVKGRVRRVVVAARARLWAVVEWRPGGGYYGTGR